MKIELLNDMYLEPQKSGGYNLYKRYTTAKGEPKRKRIAYAGDLEQAVKAFLRAVQYEELKDLHTLYLDYAERIITSNYAAASMICGKIESTMSYQEGEN